MLVGIDHSWVIPHTHNHNRRPRSSAGAMKSLHKLCVRIAEYILLLDLLMVSTLHRMTVRMSHYTNEIT